MPPVTLRALVESNQRLADATLGQSHAINKLATSFERLQPAFEQLRHDLYDLKSNRELDNDALRLSINEVNTKLALVLDNVKDVKDITGSHILPPPEHKKPKVVEIIEAVERLSVTTKILLFVFIIVAALSGWLTHFLAG